MASVYAEPNNVVVVANAQNDISSLSKKEVRNLFMGGVVDGNYDAVALTQGNDARQVFNIKVVGLTESRIQAYWAQRRFSGRSKPPRELKSVDEVIAYLMKNKNAVAYLPENTPIPEELTVVYATQ